mmetsp:Transcript_69105/g.156673  ORF Transcript_69105/g.156673 Transcript_69105/m.156673 type:complete len:202 (-) Transcript_69105:1879-2484(-)
MTIQIVHSRRETRLTLDGHSSEATSKIPVANTRRPTPMNLSVRSCVATLRIQGVCRPQLRVKILLGPFQIARRKSQCVLSTLGTLQSPCVPCLEQPWSIRAEPSCAVTPKTLGARRRPLTSTIPGGPCRRERRLTLDAPYAGQKWKSLCARNRLLRSQIQGWRSSSSTGMMQNAPTPKQTKTTRNGPCRKATTVIRPGPCS